MRLSFEPRPPHERKKKERKTQAIWLRLRGSEATEIRGEEEWSRSEKAWSEALLLVKRVRSTVSLHAAWLLPAIVHVGPEFIVMYLKCAEFHQTYCAVLPEFGGSLARMAMESKASGR